MHVSGVKGEARKAEGYSEIHAALARDARERFKVESAGRIGSICKHRVSQHIDTICTAVILYVVVQSS